MIFDKRTCAQDKVFDVVDIILLAMAFLFCIYPLYFVLIASISDPDLVNSGKIILLPKGINIEAYKTVLKDPRIITGYTNTIIYTVLGSALAVGVTVLAAFPLSRKDMLGHKLFTWFFLLPMYFSGGIIPIYIQAKNLGLVNTRGAIIVIGCLNIYNLIVCRTFFANNIPDELWEAASIDGCSMYKFFFMIVMPLSKAIASIMVLYYAVAQWNEFFRALMYLNKSALYPLQLILRDMLIANQSMMVNADPNMFEQLSKQAESMKYAVIIVSSLPVLMLYPYIQRFFVKGVMVGAIKG